MRLRDQIILEARELIRAELGDPTPDGIVRDVQRLVASTRTAEDAYALGAMFAALERIRIEAFGDAADSAEQTEADSTDVGLTE